MTDKVAYNARAEALGDMYDALERLAEADDVTLTMTGRDRLYAATRALTALALLWAVPKVADAVEALERHHGL